jgi:hypothetical protein
MSRRIEIELTSSRDDGTWTWRALGAREPKGTLPGSILPFGAKVGDALRVDAEFYLEGIEITSVLPAKGGRTEPERLEIIGTPVRDEQLVTSTLAPRDERRGPRRERGDRPDRPDRGDRRPGGDRPDRRPSDRGDRSRPDGGRGRPDGARRSERPASDTTSERPPRSARPPRPERVVEEKPKPKRLRPAKVHRTALLESLAPEQGPIAEQLVLGGLPAVRQAIDKQNEERKAAGEPEVKVAPLMAMAEELLPKVRAAEWRDRADAALADVEEIDLRDLRSVVTGADGAGRDDESRQLAASLRQALAARVDKEHAAWLAEIKSTLHEGRVVRALRISSRPPKAGSPLPKDLAAQLIDATNASLTSDASADRWSAVLDALAFAPVRRKVVPASLPTSLSDDLRQVIARLADRLPELAHIFAIEPAPAAARKRPDRPKRPPRKKTGAKPKVEEAKVEEAKVEEAKVEEAKVEEAKVEEPVADEPSTPSEPEIDLRPVAAEESGSTGS